MRWGRSGDWEDMEKLTYKFVVNPVLNGARMPYKRSLGLRRAFRFKLKTAKFQPNRFVHIFLSL
jgi:hypothetical protein